MRTSNPALSESAFRDAVGEGTSSEVMTINGTVGKTALLLLTLLVTAFWTWNLAYSTTAITPDGQVIPGNMGAVMPLLLLGVIGGLVVALVTIFKKTWSPITAPIYAALEGLALGAISAFFEMQFPNIVVQAVALTFGTMAALLMAYRSGLIKVTENFRMMVVAATGGIALFYLVSIGARLLFGFQMPMIHDSGPVGIAFSVFVVAIAALNLVLDFDFIERGAEARAPKYMEWYAAFGLLVTLVWLYLEILRLLSKLRSR